MKKLRLMTSPGNTLKRGIIIRLLDLLDNRNLALHIEAALRAKL